MYGNSRPIRSAQRDVHADLPARVRKHLQQPWRRPLADHTQRAFRAVAARAEVHPGPIVIDAGCGTGASTRMIAACSPAALVIGVDKSPVRLSPGPPVPPVPPVRRPEPGLAGELAEGSAGQPAGMPVLLRADLQDFWRLALAEGWRPARQYILYPNPWPKPGQLARRWHGHPVFPWLVALGGALELRSNWRIYVDEFAAALSLCGVAAEIEPVRDVGAAVSPFERKYLASGQRCWRLVAELGQAVLPCGRAALAASMRAP